MKYTRFQLFHRDHHDGHHGHHHHHHHEHDHDHDHNHHHHHGDDYTSDADIYPEQFIQLFQQGKSGTVIDVRDPYELGQVKIKGSVSIPLREICKQIIDLDPQETYFLICSQGFRASYAAQYMNTMGFEKIYNVQTGIFGIYEFLREHGEIPEWLEVKPEWSPKVV